MQGFEAPNVYIISDSFLFVKGFFEFFYFRANFFIGNRSWKYVCPPYCCGCLKSHGILPSETVESVKIPFVPDGWIAPDQLPRTDQRWGRRLGVDRLPLSVCLLYSSSFSISSADIFVMSASPPTARLERSALLCCRRRMPCSTDRSAISLYTCTFFVCPMR